MASRSARRNYARQRLKIGRLWVLLRETGRADEAAKMEARAKAIRAKYE